MATFMEQKDASLINKLAYRENESDMEHIVLKPSAELIPDEYQHTDNKAALVHIFRGEYKHDALNTKALIVSLNQLGYEVPYKNVHFIRRKEQVQKDLDNIVGETDGKSCLLIFFLDVYKEGDKLMLFEEPNDYLTTKDVWINFTAYNCPNLRNKPKIFIFHATKFISNKIQHDAVSIKVNSSFYDVPAEADMLIVYNRVEEDRLKRQFIVDFCHNLDENGNRDDIINLITQTDHFDNVKSLMISTLTKKFYFKQGNVRDHHWDIHANQMKLQETLSDLHDKVEVVTGNTISSKNVDATGSKDHSLEANQKTVTDSVRKRNSNSTSRNGTKLNERPPWRY